MTAIQAEEEEEGVPRRDDHCQDSVLHCVCRPVHEFSVCDLLKSKTEALASLTKFVLSVGRPENLRQNNAKDFQTEQIKICCFDSSIIQEKTRPETPRGNGLAERRFAY